MGCVLPVNSGGKEGEDIKEVEFREKSAEYHITTASLGLLHLILLFEIKNGKYWFLLAIRQK